MNIKKFIEQDRRPKKTPWSRSKIVTKCIKFIHYNANLRITWAQNILTITELERAHLKLFRARPCIGDITGLSMKELLPSSSNNNAWNQVDPSNNKLGVFRTIKLTNRLALWFKKLKVFARNSRNGNIVSSGTPSHHTPAQLEPSIIVLSPPELSGLSAASNKVEGEEDEEKHGAAAGAEHDLRRHYFSEANVKTLSSKHLFPGEVVSPPQSQYGDIRESVDCGATLGDLSAAAYPTKSHSSRRRQEQRRQSISESRREEKTGNSGSRRENYGQTSIQSDRAPRILKTRTAAVIFQRKVCSFTKKGTPALLY